MHNWLESNGYLTGWITILLTFRRDVRRLVRRSLPAVKRGAAAVAGYVTLKVVVLYLRFCAPKEVVQEAMKWLFFLAIGSIIVTMLEEMPKTSKLSAA
jgi:hypothetical protein